MFAMTSGTTNRPKTIPVTDQSLSDYREGWTIWGILAFDAHPAILHKGLKPILQIASDWRESFTPVGHPLRCDYRADGPHAEPPDPVHLLHAADRRPDQGHRIEILRGAAVLGPPRPGSDHRGQPEHHPGHRPARRPRKGVPDPRPFRRHHRLEVADQPRNPRGARAAGRSGAARPRRGGWRRSSSAPAGSSPATTGPTSASWPTGPAARWGPISAAIPNTSAIARSATSG